MKLFLVISLIGLASCTKKISCGFLDAPIAILAQNIAIVGECDAAIVEDELKKALIKINVCEEKVAVSGMNAAPIFCNLAPTIAGVLGDVAGHKAGCKKVGAITADVIKKALKCEGSL